MVAYGPSKAKKSAAKGQKVYSRKRAQAIADDNAARKRTISKQISNRNKAEGQRVRKLTARGKK